MRSPKEAYNDQQRHATDRGLPWLFTYAEWLEMWLLSGKWEDRGRKQGQYQMCRYGDSGGYFARNCYIATVAVNQAERHNVDSGQTAAIIEMWQTSRLSQYKIADAFGLNQSTISRIINGVRRVG